jgi:hypothetical protein
MTQKAIVIAQKGRKIIFATEPVFLICSIYGVVPRLLVSVLVPSSFLLRSYALLYIIIHTHTIYKLCLHYNTTTQYNTFT